MTEQTDQIAEKVDVAVEGEEIIDTFVTSTGYKLKISKMHETLVQRLWSQFPPVQPPEVEVTSRGKTWKEVNYDDPNYAEARTRRLLDFGEAFLRLILLKSVKIEEYPENAVPFEEDTEWIDEMEFIGLSVPEKTTARYVEWMRYRVVTTSTDVDVIQDIATKLSGVTEEGVKQAMDRFPNLTKQ